MKRVRCKVSLMVKIINKFILFRHHVDAETILAHVTRRSFQLTNFIRLTENAIKFWLNFQMKKKMQTKKITNLSRDGSLLNISVGTVGGAFWGTSSRYDWRDSKCLSTSSGVMWPSEINDIGTILLLDCIWNRMQKS